VAGLAYFAVIGRHRLILSPEEQFALASGNAGSAPEGVTAEASELESHA
jgi:hypothetical protein